MEISINPTENGLLFTLSGRLDTLTAPRLQEALSGLSPDVKALRFDLSGLEYVSSAGLRVFLTAQKAMMACGGQMTIANPNATVKGVFDLTGCSDIFTIV